MSEMQNLRDILGVLENTESMAVKRLMVAAIRSLLSDYATRNIKAISKSLKTKSKPPKTYNDDGVLDCVKLRRAYPLSPTHEQIGTDQGKIPCIKAVRNDYRIGLIEAKALVESWFEHYGLRFKGY